MFSEIAPRYDLLNHVLSLNIDRLWRRDLVRAAGLPVDGRVLDACTGTADVAIGFARQLTDGYVVGVDRSGGMLAVGRQKIGKTDLDGRIELLEGDILDLPFADGVFDAVTIAFGLRNLPDYAEGVCEMARVLKPGGKLLILEFCPPEKSLYLKGYKFYLQRVLPFVGGIISGSRRAYRYLATSIGEFLTVESVRELMGTAGLSDFSARKLAGGIAYIYSGEKRPRRPDKTIS
jgi:demethylmenaquinone methyltransferase/2-methoxy-6-polyprenyl-1,4-benzoquinol methylase